MSKVISISVPDLDRIMADFADTLQSLGDNQGKAVASAINASLQLVRAEAAKIARTAYTARRSKLFDYIKVDRASKGKTVGTLRIRDKRGVSLINFQALPKLPAVRSAEGATKNKRPTGGVTVKVLRGGPREVRGSEKGGSKPFIMKKKQGGFGVFVRHGKNDEGKDVFEMLHGPSPIQALQREEDQARLNEVAAKAFPRLLEEEISKLLSRGRG